ncbi:hypothetical protein HY36_08620 [Hyphomonas atlantica]|uniref:Uncharacterized protein n=2 Tax=Hyphomonadaceae TaxID=69657 RepID=A0A059DXW3_9PROT|nr:hypothetical protein HY36_08620 [Hyphomonas atlantica]MAM07231.1 hypothetical protein [Hyphomonas sp.]
MQASLIRRFWKLTIMFEEKKNKNSKSWRLTLFGFPPVVNAYLVLTLIFLIALIFTSIWADHTGGDRITSLFAALLDLMKLVVGAAFGALTANFAVKR